MSEKNQIEKIEKIEKIDKMLEVLSRPISWHILAILTGVNPGEYEGKINPKNRDTEDSKE